MTDHVHTWAPAEGVMARYRCACGAWGRRPKRGGAIVAMKAPPWDEPATTVTARPSVIGACAVTPGGVRDRVPLAAGFTFGSRRVRRAPGAP